MLNISFINQANFEPVSFGHRLPKTDKAKVQKLATDVVHITKGGKLKLPERFELTESEEAFNEVLKKVRRVEMNMKTQRQDMRDYYSSSSRYEYQELSKERTKLVGQLRRMAKKEGRDVNEMEFDIEGKKTYNRYAPKILKATNKDDLAQIQQELETSFIFVEPKKLLLQLIEQRKKTLKK